MMRKRLIVTLVLAVVAIGLWFLFVGDCDLPDASQVVAMKANLGHGVLDVPPSHFASILAALRPCRRDSHDLKWAALGELDMTLKDGSHFHISVDYTGEKEGAFSAGSGIRYRGGTDKGFEAAMLAARQEIR